MRGEEKWLTRARRCLWLSVVRVFRTSRVVS
jgi:hypothetical protein